MESLFVIAFGVMVSVAAYLLMSRNLLRSLLGLLVLGNAANLAIFIAGRMGSSIPPLVPEGALTIAESANPLPQALILTAIVISFALVVFAAVLFQRAHESLGTLDADAMREAEPRPGDATSDDASDEASDVASDDAGDDDPEEEAR